jgi:UDP-N-acetylglucosamine 4,6-dehydratase/5-epimerase
MKKGKTLLITGGTGSFGNAVLRKFIKTDFFNEIRIFSRDEKKQDDMRQKYINEKIKYYIGDVKDLSSVDFAMEGVDFVFHAAALKQVPSCEFFPSEAVKTNINGTENVIESALKHNIKKLVLLSTDKAVYPINSMGLSKALSEKIMIAKSRSLGSKETILCATRYGNVMASRGSVIPLFINQIKLGKDITITDPSMTRFMMSLDNAVELVLYSFKNGKNGDIFVQKSPACTVEILARALLQLYDADNKIKIIGTRHGEKLFETLINREEMIKSDESQYYYRISSDNRGMDYNNYFSQGKINISKSEDYTSHNTNRLDIESTKALLLSLDLIKKDLS